MTHQQNRNSIDVALAIEENDYIKAFGGMPYPCSFAPRRHGAQRLTVGS